jgi:hypothetical protein
MDYKKVIDKLVRELSYRVGIPDVENKEHQSIMSEILSEWGEYDVKETIFEFLTNEDDTEGEDKDYAHIGKGFYVKASDKGKDGAQKYTKDDSGKLKAVSDSEYEKEKEKQGEEGEEAAKDSEQNSSGDGTSPEEEKEKKDSIKKTFNTSSQKAQRKKEKEIADKIQKEKEDTSDSESDSEEETNVEPPSFNTETSKPEKGKVSDVDDEYSDGKIKQLALEYGTKNKEKFKPAPGNAGSMMGEILSGEGFFHLDENPDLSDDELAQKLYDQIEDTKLGEENGAKSKPNSKGKYAGKKEDLWKKCISIARSAKTKHQENQKGVRRLQADGKMGKPVKTRNFYGHETSISQQVKLIESINGPIYTKEGIEVPKEVIVDLIKKSGGGENPSDTSTITIDKQGKALVTFHSDKLSTADIQANSTPNKESEKAKELIEKSNLTDIEKEDLISTVSDGQRKLEEKEEQLKSAANEPSRQMANGDVSKILDGAKNNTNSDGTPNKDKTSTRLGKIHGTRDTKKRILKYLPDGISYDDATEEQKLKAYFDYMGDDDKEIEPTGDQVTFLYRVAAQQGYNISADLSRIRKESLDVQRDTHKKLNEKSIALPNGKQVPMGDYIEGQNLIEKLHLNVMDGEKNESGVGKYPGLFNLNMGGTLVEGDELKKCIDVDGTDDFIENFEVGTPGDGEEETKNTKTGAITGRNIFVFAVTKAGKRIKVAYKTQRSKQGQSGKLSTTYQWDNGIQDCFKS